MTSPQALQPATAVSRPRARRAFGVTLVGLLIAAAAAGANYAIWAFFNPPIEASDWTGKVKGVAYSGFQRHQDPTKRRFPSEAEIDRDLALLAGITGRIRTYTAVENSAVARLADTHGLRVTAGAWLDRRADNNRNELDALVWSARSNRNVDSVVVGNETILRGDLTVPELLRHIDDAKRRTRRPVSTAEPWHIWLKYPELANRVDFITVHLLPYWEGVPVNEAVDYVFARYDELKRKYPKKRIVIGEVGWPSEGDRREGAEATPAAQAQFMREFLDVVQDRRIEYYVMEGFDQPWKTAAEGRAGPYWGIFDAYRAPKFAWTGPIVGDPHWRAKALAASLLAFAPILLFASRFRRFRWAGIAFFAMLVQASAAALVWTASVPLRFYLDPLDWIMLAMLAPALVAMIAVLLVNGFEFVETMWNRGWLRAFGPHAGAPAHEPFVSIHLPCCNEPPEMVTLTLNSLAHLDYRNFEVIVIDNNTKDEAKWKPVEAFVATLGPRFRFFHLPSWPGFKAGALNFALGQTDPRAEIIGVVDADYAVSRNWLSSLVGHFDGRQVAVVQAPQAHRDFEANAFQRMCNWEFDGFFRIGMHHRNERNAIIQHGTMTLVRRAALEQAGRWSEWCICEDAELGLRLMHEGYEIKYVDAVLGRGLTPADFKAFKSQRFRWAFGAMQILKRHWRWLTRPGPLSAGQRYHFLTGWFWWFADALHLVFSFLALAWTAGMIVAPHLFSLPLSLFVIPVFGFLAAKAFFGPALYRERVPCDWRDVIGASVASMGLSHAIARGIFEGLWRKEGKFITTTKGWQPRGRFGGLNVVREEGLMFAALALGAAGMVWRYGTGHREAMLWIAILGAQALPYLASLASAAISARSAAAVRPIAEPAPLKPVSEAPVPHLAPVLQERTAA
jgi:exo-beta-1,3-glucanase (GH17 family)/cellulose synthase/poly-beta-1,6-N-acetylglucosamine synthase-like glycosyltransferase